MNDMTSAQNQASNQTPDQVTAEQIDLENPLGVDGFEFVEFTGPEPKAMISRLEMMGFT
ncbi:MAG: 4-hydroxyphenylpyruvate dioxygenase, partial [Brevundimonas sp.]|nr:4-hydroxyphenylpyruvate dioxygenase [Brevundimonas sp.]